MHRSELDSKATEQRKTFLADLQNFGPDSNQSALLSLEESLDYCRSLALKHYENFSIASWLIPRNLRPHFFNVYAYCRWSDDLADEVGSKEKSLQLLDWWRGELRACFQGTATHPVMIALRSTLEAHSLKIEPFEDLLDAFCQDQRQDRYETDADLEAYCRGSANPVGRIVLGLAGVDDPQAMAWSDSICTGLQLANFAQDMARDAALNRIYIPKERWGVVSESDWLAGVSSEERNKVVSQWIKDIRPRFSVARDLSKVVPGWLARDIHLFAGGGIVILDAIEKHHCDVWTKRIEVGRTSKAKLLVKAMFATTIQNATVPDAFSEQRFIDLAAERTCKKIAKESHSNFYRSFSLLRPEKRKGMTALYAFARRMDDISDSNLGESEQMSRLAEWKEMVSSWKQNGVTESHSVFSNARISSDDRLIAHSLFKTHRRFNIPVSLLLDIIDGVEEDVGGSVRFANVEELERYCYRVAGAVGLCCIAIWGGDVELCRERSIQCGIAFQWTNMLRDLFEDSANDRIYFPVSDLQAFGIDEKKLLAGESSGDWNGFLDLQIQRAESSYEASKSLMNELPDDGQRMYSLMWQTYHTLLEQVNRYRDQLPRKRIRIPMHSKIRLMAGHFISPLYMLKR